MNLKEMLTFLCQLLLVTAVTSNEEINPEVVNAVEDIKAYINWTIPDGACDNPDEIITLTRFINSPTVGEIDDDIVDNFNCKDFNERFKNSEGRYLGRKHMSLNVDVFVFPPSKISLIFNSVPKSASGRYLLKVFSTYRTGLKQLSIYNAAELKQSDIKIDGKTVKLGEALKLDNVRDKKVLSVRLDPNGPPSLHIVAYGHPSSKQLKSTRCDKSESYCNVTISAADAEEGEEKIVIWVEYPEVQGSTAMTMAEIQIHAEQESNIATIIGVTVGAVVILLVSLILLVVFYRRKQNRNKAHKKVPADAEQPLIGLEKKIKDAEERCEEAEILLKQGDPTDLKALQNLKNKLKKAFVDLKNMIEDLEKVNTMPVGDVSLEYSNGDQALKYNQHNEEKEFRNKLPELLARMRGIQRKIQGKVEGLRPNEIKWQAEEYYHDVVILTPGKNRSTAKEVLKLLKNHLKLKAEFLEDLSAGTKLFEAVEDAVMYTSVLFFVVPTDLTMMEKDGEAEMKRHMALVKSVNRRSGFRFIPIQMESKREDSDYREKLPLTIQAINPMYVDLKNCEEFVGKVEKQVVPHVNDKKQDVLIKLEDIIKKCLEEEDDAWLKKGEVGEVDDVSIAGVICQATDEPHDGGVIPTNIPTDATPPDHSLEEVRTLMDVQQPE